MGSAKATTICLAAPIQVDSIVDGGGVRTVIWTQGCPHHCEGCQNPETQPFKGGLTVKISQIKRQLAKLTHQDGITFSGGDPMNQVEACLEVAEYALSLGMNIWCFTGYTYEQLLKLAEVKQAYMDFLKLLDVLVDGRFVLAKKSYNLRFKGSSNQRIIDVPASLATKKVCLLEKYSSLKTYQPLYQKDSSIFV